MPTNTVLASEVAKVAARIRRAAKGRINEQNTKASMIEPILRALGWDTEDVDAVVRECGVASPASLGTGSRSTAWMPDYWMSDGEQSVRRPSAPRVRTFPVDHSCSSRRTDQSAFRLVNVANTQRLNGRFSAVSNWPVLGVPRGPRNPVRSTSMNCGTGSVEQTWTC